MSAGRTVMVQGRIVWASGDLFKGRVKTIFGTQTPRVNQAGETMMEYGFGLAVPKASLGEIWGAIHEEAFTLFPNRQIPPGFAMKYKDGDGIDDKGVPFSQREGYAEHLVFACTTSLPIKFFKYENGQNIMVNEGIKCGDYVNVQLSIKAHGAIAAGKAGLYINPNAVQFLGFGKEIINAPSGDQIFGSAMPAIPQGASATPLVPQPGQMLVPPPQQYAPPIPTSAPPNYAVVPAAHQPQAQPQYATPPMPMPPYKQ